MAVPLPDASTVNLVPPDAVETELMARAFATAAAGPGGLTEVQRAVVNATVEAMTGFALDVAALPPLGPDEFAEAMRRRDLRFRQRMVQVMLLLELLLVPLPPEVTKQVQEYADALGVEDDMLRVTDKIASGSLGLALIDFERSGYFQTMLERPPAHLHTVGRARRCVGRRGRTTPRSRGGGRHSGRVPRARSVSGSGASTAPVGSAFRVARAARRRASRSTTGCTCSPTTGRRSSARSRCSASSPVRTTTRRGSRCWRWCSGCSRPATCSTPRRASSSTTAGTSRATRTAWRCAWPTRWRAARTAAWYLDDHGRETETDFTATDWFEYADWPLEDVRAHFGIRPKSAKAIACGIGHARGSPGGISPFQYRHGREVAEAAGEEYDSYGATPPDA